MSLLFDVIDGSGQIVATSIHSGHELRPEVRLLLTLHESERLREEDPYTNLLAQVVPLRVDVPRSRFEVDLNRPREDAVYRRAAQAWGLELWSAPPSTDIVETSLAIYDAFYEEMTLLLDRLANRGRFAVLDVHSYNHRRNGSTSPPAPSRDNPDVNLGTGSIDAAWRPLVERFSSDLVTHLPDGAAFGENVRFRGGHFSRWVNERYRGVGCALAIEFKKTFMDEWTGKLDLAHLEKLQHALRLTIPGLEASLTGVPCRR
jgi:N-formylglutamate deformylase